MDNQVPTNLLLRCKDCGAEFLWSVREQEFYKERDYEPPKRCPHCRIEKRLRYGKPERGGGYDG